MQEVFARVALFCPPYEELIYRVPESLKNQVAVGDTMRVPLNRRQVTGLLIELGQKSSVASPKEIIEHVRFAPRVGLPLLKLCRWAADYYLSKLGTVLCSVLPTQVLTERRTVWMLGHVPEKEALSGVEAEILSELQAKGRASLQRLNKKFHGEETAAVLCLLEKNLISFDGISENMEGAQCGVVDEPPHAFLPLNQEQYDAVSSISQSVDCHEFQPFLLHGVTGSGKTEVYLRVIDRVEENGLGSLVMVPEIGLTPQLSDRMKARFGARVAVIHSGLSEKERILQWEKIQAGKCSIVVGARSAVFAPLKDVGIIVVDEEHDPSYKQEEGFRYNGRDLAIVRGRISQCPVVLGSATPSMESYQNAVRGRYLLLNLSERIEKKPQPIIDWVDLRQCFRKGEANFLSPDLIKNLEDNWRRGRQSLLFLNRRGFAQYLLCTLCGFVLMCPNCSVTLTFHRGMGQAQCHYCNHSVRVPNLCPRCGSAKFRGIGVGTERLHSEVEKLFPNAHIQRMDRDAVRKKGAHQTIISDWEAARIDILVGTQMVTKGHDVPGVTLVGVLLAEASLNLPDFRAAERTFQLITQVAGRAGRGHEKGKVIVQTFNPDHYVFQCIREGGIHRFFEQEVKIREALGYPPFARLVQIRVVGLSESKVKEAAIKLGGQLKKRVQSKSYYGKIQVLGPAPAAIPRIRNRYRWQLLLKGKDTRSLRNLTLEARDLVFPELATRGIRMSVDVDPIHMV
jgi:primosomal protein N' (replication factor Y)